MAETEETPQIDETRLQAIRRRIEEVAGDAPQLAKLALEQMVTKHNPDLKGTAGSAGRVGAQSGNVSELTAIANLKPGGADRLKRIFGLVNGNFDGAQKVGTLHNMRFVFFDNDTRILFATAYDGDWDTYINDFATKGAFAGGGGILRQARPDSRREILLVAAFYGRARKATAQFYPAMATHFEGVWPNAPILNEAERTPKSLCRFIRFQHGQPNLCGTSRSGPAFDRRVN
ncbi:hypothetical protein [Sphingobium yanoikuyae]|uniref:hypothetical protein n=1 Tax=Sphingobium yanoikuyae TaxID=13690 RepID=UPI0032642237